MSEDTGIPNFAEVAPGIYRGGQPTPAGWKYLQDLGIKSVIKLNMEYEGIDDPGFPVEIFKFPISLAAQVLTEPDLQSIRDVIGFITPGTFVHCQHGCDRTGLVIGCWRRTQGWTQQAAWDEMLEHGFNQLLFGLVKGWFDFQP